MVVAIGQTPRFDGDQKQFRAIRLAVQRSCLEKCSPGANATIVTIFGVVFHYALSRQEVVMP